MKLPTPEEIEKILESTEGRGLNPHNRALAATVMAYEQEYRKNKLSKIIEKFGRKPEPEM